ncbi:hypothetical protein ACAG39_09995 [Caldicellulosiruptoraceae bacterium PP1]
MGEILILFLFYVIKVFLLVSIILHIFNINVNYKRLVTISIIQGLWDSIVFGGSINLIVGIILMSITLILLFILFMKISPVIGIIIGLIAQSVCLMLKFGGLTIISIIDNVTNIFLSKFIVDFLPLLFENLIMGIMLYLIISKKYVLYNIYNLTNSQLEQEPEKINER